MPNQLFERAFYVRKSPEIDSQLENWQLKSQILSAKEARDCRFVVLLTDREGTFIIDSLLEIEGLVVESERDISCSVTKRTLLRDADLAGDLALTFGDQAALDISVFTLNFSKYFHTYCSRPDSRTVNR
nr:hypothetical protein FFPRI1PSEUD_44400 [Pseudomonas sp. FFPRI_1]